VSVRFVMLPADVPVDYAPAGSVVGEDLLARGAILLSGDDVVVLEGSDVELERLAHRILSALPFDERRWTGREPLP
jgi:hypothetical protein